MIDNIISEATKNTLWRHKTATSVDSEIVGRQYEDLLIRGLHVKHISL